MSPLHRLPSARDINTLQGSTRTYCRQAPLKLLDGGAATSRIRPAYKRKVSTPPVFIIAQLSVTNKERVQKIHSLAQMHDHQILHAYSCINTTGNGREQPLSKATNTGPLPFRSD
jgi:hypothetical protein